MKGKKNWKNVDISAVETQLEELRNEEILGGKIHLKDSNELFVIDTVGNEKMRDSIKKKTLVIDDIIKPMSGVSSIIQKKMKNNLVKDMGEYKTRMVSKTMKLSIEKTAKKKQKLGLGIGSQQALRRKMIKSRINKVQRAKGGYDLWNTEKVDIDPYLETAVQKPVKKPILKNQRPLGIPAVEVIHPGSSYKPSESDHKQAIDIAAAVEFKKLDKNEAIDQNLSYPKELDELPDETFFGNESDESQDSDDQEQSVPITGVRPKQKQNTRSDLNRKKKHKEQLLQQQNLRNEKTILKQINQIKQIEKELLEKDLESKKRAELKKKLDEMNALMRTRKLGRYGFQPASVEIKLSDEIPDNLTRLKPEELAKEEYGGDKSICKEKEKIQVKRSRVA